MLALGDMLLFWLRCCAGIFFVFGTLYVVFVLNSLLGEDDSVALRWCSACVFGLWLASSAFHALMVLEIFSLLPALIGLSVVVGFLRLRGYSFRSFFSTIWRDGKVFMDFFVDQRVSIHSFLLLILLAGALGVGARALLLPPLAWDTLTYHMVKAGMWVQNGNPWLMAAPGGWDVYRSLFGGGEILHAWALLIFQGDYLACTVDFVVWLFLMPAVYSLGQSVGLKPTASMAVAIYCGFTPAILFSVGACYVDIILALALVLASTFGFKYFSEGNPRHLLLCFLALGVAGGVKLSAYAVILVVVLFCAGHILCTKRKDYKHWTLLGLSLLLMGIPIVPWLWYNFEMTGHILYPFPVKVGGISLGVASPTLTWHMDVPNYEPWTLWKELEALKCLFDYPILNKIPDFGIDGLLPLTCGFVALAKLIRSQRWGGLLLLAIVAAQISFFFLPSFWVIRLKWSHSNARFLFAAFCLIVVLSPLFFSSLRQRIYADFLLMASCLHVAFGVYLDWNRSELPYIVGIGFLAVVASIFVCLAKKKFGRGPSVAAFCLLSLILVTALYAARHFVRFELATRSYFFHEIPSYWVQAAREIDRPDSPRRIAVTGGPVQNGDNWFTYMFMGRSLQNRIQYLPVTRSGSVVVGRRDSSCFPDADYRSWLRRIRTEGITEVMSFGPPSMEHRWMAEHPEIFHRIWGNDQYGLFRVVDHQ